MGNIVLCRFDEIKAAYKLYALKFHPDKYKDDKFFKENFQESS